MRNTVVAAVLVIAATASATPATAATPPLTLEGASVIHYGTSDYAFQETSRLIRQGQRSATGGCEFEGTETTRGDEIVDEIELAYDKATCQLLVRRGHLLSDREFMTADDGAGEDTAAREQSARVAGDGAALAAAATASASAYSARSAYTWSWYDEPARWVHKDCDVEEGFADGCFLPPVNHVRNTVTWTPDGTCAMAPGTSGSVGSYSTWLVYTGWTHAGHQWAHSPGTVYCPSDIYSVTTDHFRNSIFCQALVNLLPLPSWLKPDVEPTNTYYRPNEVRGYADGSSYHRWSLSKDGGCSDFLRAGRRYGSGLG